MELHCADLYIVLAQFKTFVLTLARTLNRQGQVDSRPNPVRRQQQTITQARIVSCE
jgi:hypothetical protein